jgi:putative DNA primase/helicase
MGTVARFPNPLLEAAISYAERGWRVNPLKPGTKACDFTGVDVLQHSSTDINRIREWWAEEPKRNVGLVPGAESGFVVIDIDVKNGARGREALAFIESKVGPIPSTRREGTPSGGEHIFFAHPGGELANTSGSKDLSGIDFFGSPTNLVVAPSVAGGKPYTLTDQSPVAALPAGLHDIWKKWGSGNTKPSRRFDVTNRDSKNRNNAAYAFACSLRAKGIPEDAAWRMLLEFPCNPPLKERELRQIHRSALKHPLGDPAPSHFATTDLGNAKRIAARYGSQLIYVPDFGKFMTWGGTHWEMDSTGDVERLTKHTVRAIFDEVDEAEKEKDKDRKNDLKKWASTSQMAARIEAAQKLLKTEPGIPKESKLLDCDPMLLAVLNGTVDLNASAAIRLRPSEPDDYSTKVSAITYDLSAKAPRWEAFVSELTEGVQELVKYLQAAVGYSLTGSTDEQCMFLMYGGGNNGKSTFLRILRDLLGDYGATTDPTTWMVRDGRGPSNDLAALRGARIVASTETEEGHRFAEVMIKQATGGDALKARFLYHEFFEYTPQFKIWMAANHKPVIKGDDTAIWRRIRLIPAQAKISPENKDRKLYEKLKQELPGILNWAIEGCIRWQSEGLVTPKAVTEATKEYRDESDYFRQFVADRCEKGSALYCTAKSLYHAYTEWAREQGVPAFAQWSMQMFSRKLTEHDYDKKRHDDAVYYYGLKVRSEHEPVGGM